MAEVLETVIDQVDTSATDAVDTTVDTTTTDDATDQTTDATDATDATDQTDGTDGAASTLPLFRQAQKTFDALKAEGKIDAKLARDITKALIRDGKGTQALPDGYEKAAQVLKDVQTLAYPGQEGQPLEQVFTAVKAELAGWRDFDVKITKGDPSIVAELAEASPEGFQNLVPAALERYAALNPDAYSTIVTQAVVADMQASQIPLHMRMMESFIPRLPDSPEKQEIIKAYNALVDWTNKLSTHAQRPIKAVKGSEPKPGEEGKGDPAQLAQQREEGLTRQLWNAQSNGFGVTMIAKEAARLAGAGISEADQNRIRIEVDKELAFRFSQDDKFKQSMNAFLRARNYEGYKRLLHSKYGEIIPAATQRAIALLGIKAGKGGAAKAATNGAKPGTQGRQVLAKPGVKNEPVFERIAGHPRTVPGMPRIDLGKTTTEMMLAGKGILIGGRHVRWR